MRFAESTVTVLSPPESVGTIDITVVSPEGSSADSGASRYTYTLASLPTISSISASYGISGGGNTITISGSHLIDAMAVDFGTIAAQPFWIISDSTLTALVPAQGVGTVDVRVTTQAGISATGSSDQYTYTSTSAPTVTSLATTSGPHGRGYAGVHQWHVLYGCFRSGF